VNYGGVPELSIVVPTVDALSERVRDCVASLRTSTEADHELLLLENRSPPQGFTAPVNAGIRAARGRYIVVLNDDVELLEGWWPPLRRALEGGAWVAVPDAGGGYPRDDYFAAWCLAFEREAIERVGHAPGEFFNPEYKIWYQDLELLLHLCEAGHPPVVVQSPIRHRWGRTVKHQEGELRAWIDEQIERDRQAFISHWPGGRRGERARRLLEPVLRQYRESQEDGPPDQ